MASVDLLMHPVRLRIVQALLGDRTLTASDLRQELPDVPTATLYRQMAQLTRGKVIEVVAERRVRGTVERSYALIPQAALVSVQELRRMSGKQHRAAFRVFLASLLADFDRYADRDDIDPVRDMVGYRQVALWVTDQEAAQMVADLNRVVGPLLDNAPGPGRIRRMFSTVLLPAGASEGR